MKSIILCLRNVKFSRAIRRISIVVCGLTLFSRAARADNPIIQTIYTADPAPLVFNDRVYLYTGHDEDGSTNFTMREWRGVVGAGPGGQEPLQRRRYTQ